MTVRCKFAASVWHLRGSAAVQFIITLPTVPCTFLRVLIKYGLDMWIFDKRIFHKA